MNPAARLVVADTTPLNYLIWIGAADILCRLFGEILVPEAVWRELNHVKAPQPVRRWLEVPPDWITIAAASQVDSSIGLGAGENEAISLALEHQVKLVLMDERKGRAAAQGRGLLTLGTLNLLDLADARGLLNGLEALDLLRRTSFRASEVLLEQFDGKMQDRRNDKLL